MTEANTHDEGIPEISPALQIYEKEVTHEVPIAVIDNALAELNREDEEVKRDAEIPPPRTIN